MQKAVAIYLRLSREDLDVRQNAAKDESNSISAQRSLITQHLEEMPELAVLPRMEFCDDGFSGTNFERPDFQRMMELTKQGEIGSILVKDLSRFGRDYLEVGDYLDHVFPFLGVRFIAINDHYDSLSHDGKTIGMDVAFRNLVYDYYSKDLSAKVKTAMRLKQEKGEYVTCCPYGYQTSPENKHKMMIDEPAAGIVREVFSDVIAGKSTSEIAASLNLRGIPTPSEYHGIHRRSSTSPQWTHPYIVSMIRNIKYTGAMVNHTKESRFIRDKAQRRVPKDEWIIHPDAHEAIIPYEQWEIANEKLRSPKKGTKKARNQEDRVYYCAHCGRKLQKTYGSDQYYSCLSAKYQCDSACAAIRLRRSEMENILLDALRLQISLVGTPEKSKKKKVDPAKEYSNAVSQIGKEMEQLQSKKLERYEAYRAGKIDRQKFVEIKDQIAAQIEQLQQKKTELEKKYQAQTGAGQYDAKARTDISKAKRILSDCEAGLREHLYDAIEKVIVTSNDQIEIKWTFADTVNFEQNRVVNL